MRLSNPLARLSRPTPMSALELLLLLLVAVQAARLVWALATPVGPVGAWSGPASPGVPAPSASLADFDPFFRLQTAGPGIVTSLNLKLFGVREDRATGRGSAIIALPDGRQMSFAVGEEIMPGVILAEVGSESVTIDHQGRREQIFLDQSDSTPAIDAMPVPATPAPATVSPMQVAPPAPPPPPPPSGQPVQFQPRTANGRINGVVVSPGADGQLFRSAGFAPGDVIVAVEGRPVSSLEQVRMQLARGGSDVSIMVDRGGRAIPLRVRLSR